MKFSDEVWELQRQTSTLKAHENVEKRYWQSFLKQHVFFTDLLVQEDYHYLHEKLRVEKDWGKAVRAHSRFCAVHERSRSRSRGRSPSLSSSAERKRKKEECRQCLLRHIEEYEEEKLKRRRTEQVGNRLRQR